MIVLSNFAFILGCSLLVMFAWILSNLLVKVVVNKYTTITKRKRRY